MPISSPVVKGTRALPAASSVASRTAGCLSGEPKCGPPRCDSRSAVVSIMVPCETLTALQRGELLLAHHPGIEVRQQAGLLQHQPRHGGEIGERRRVAERGQFLARLPVAQLRLVAEREQGLVAAGPRAGARDGEHLVRGEEGALAAPRRMGEGAVVADIAAELGERDEHLARDGDDVAEPGIAHPRRGGGKGGDVIVAGQRHRLVAPEAAAREETLGDRAHGYRAHPSPARLSPPSSPAA